MPAFNVRLLERCLALGDKDHYRKGGRETDLFARGPQSTAGAAGDTLRRGRVETHEGRQVRDCCLWSNKAVRCRHLFWTVMAFILDSVGGRHRCDMRAPVPLVS